MLVEKYNTFDKPDEVIEKIKSKNFREQNKSFSDITLRKLLFQRFMKNSRFKILKNNSSVTKGGNEEECIIFEHQDTIVNNKYKRDIENAIPLDISEIDNVCAVTDKEFRKACINSSIICHKYARIFIFAELIGHTASVIAAVLLPFAEFLNISKEVLITIMTIIIPIIVLHVTCDWGKLIEKYSRLCVDFNKLSRSKNNDKFDRYNELCENFRSSWIYSDMIIMSGGD